MLEVLDVNDNPPCFRTALKQPPCSSNSSEDSLVFGVPISARPGDFIGVIEVQYCFLLVEDLVKNIYNKINHFKPQSVGFVCNSALQQVKMQSEFIGVCDI